MRDFRERSFWMGAFAGSVVAILALEPATSSIRKLFLPSSRLEELARENARLRDAASARTNEAEQCRGELSSAQFRLEAQSGRSAEKCELDLISVRGVSIKEQTSSRFVGGRIYLGVEDAWTTGSPAGCAINLSTDLSVGKASKRLAVGESVEVRTGVGIFLVVLAAVPDGVTCVFDVVRPR
jgi:hypothetical protein